MSSYLCFSKIRKITTLFFLGFVSFFLIIPSGFSQKQTNIEEEESALSVRGLFNDQLYDLSLSEAEKFEKNFPKSILLPEIIYIHASSLFFKGKEEESIKKFKEVLNRFPLSEYTEDAMHRLSLALYNLGDFQGAYDRSELLLIKFPNSKYKKEIQFRRILLLYRLERYEQLAGTFETYQKLNVFSEKDSPQWNILNYYYALSLEQIDRKSEAVPLMKTLLKSDLPEEYRVILDIRLVKIQQENAQPEQHRVLFQKLKDYYSTEQGLRLLDIQIAMSLADQEDLTSDAPEIDENIRKMKQDLETFQDSNTPDVLFALGRLYKKAGKNDEAVDIFLRFQKEYPKAAERKRTSLYLADLYEKQGASDKVVAQLFQSLKGAKNEEEKNDISFKIAKYYITKNKPDKALAQLNLLKEPSSVLKKARYYFLKASAFFLSKDYAAAVESFEKIPKQSSEYNLIFNEYFIALIESGESKKFLEFFKNQSEKIPQEKRKEAIQLKYKVYFAEKKCAEALKEEEEMLAFEPNLKKDPDFFRFRGDCALQNGDEKKYVDSYWKAFRLFPEKDTENKLAIADSLSVYYQKKENYRALADVYRLSIPLISDKKLKNQSRLYLGKIWESRLENPKKAIPWYQSLTKQPGTEEGREAGFLLAEIYIRQKKVDQARKTLVQITKNLPQSSAWFTPVNYRLGQIYQSQQDWNNALRAYRKVLKKKADLPENKDALKQVLSIKEYLKSSQ